MTTMPDVSTSYDENAQAIRRELNRLVQSIRGFTLLTPERRRQVAVSGHVDDDFLRSISLLLDAHDDVARTSGITSAEIRDHLSFYSAHQGVGEELMLNGRKAIDTLIAERARVGERAIKALNVARSISAPSGPDALVPHLEAIERDFTRGRRKRALRKPPDPEAAAAKKAPKA